MDGWVGGWMGGWMDGWVGSTIDSTTYCLLLGWIEMGGVAFVTRRELYL